MATLKKNAETKSTKEEAKVVKTAAKAEKKAAPKAEKPAAKKTTTKKAAAAKSAAKPVAKKEVVAVQFAGKEYNVDAVVEAAKADFKANNKGSLRSINVYIKPEDDAAYYVVNGKVQGKVDL